MTNEMTLRNEDRDELLLHLSMVESDPNQDPEAFRHEVLSLMGLYPVQRILGGISKAAVLIHNAPESSILVENFRLNRSIVSESFRLLLTAHRRSPAYVFGSSSVGSRFSVGDVFRAH